VPDDQYRIFPLGDSALTVEFGTAISVDLNEKAVAVASYFEQFPFPGFIEAVPAYASATIFYDVIAVRNNFPGYTTSFDGVRSLVTQAIQSHTTKQGEPGRHIEITVDFSSEAALDLEHVAASHDLSTRSVIDIFTSQTYRVFMLGFLPGFAYMGEVDERIATPRKETPRLKVPRGSVGIAGKQTGIYSLESPGGWQIIGRTDEPMFIPDSENPGYLQPGDTVRFIQAP
jgi:inhibitor of KinA